MTIYRSLGPLSRLVADIPWPVDFLSPDDLPTFLEKIYVLDYQFDTSATGFSSTFWLAFEGELSVALPGLDGVKLVAGGGDVAGLTFATASLAVGDETTLTLNNIRLAMRFDPTILKPVALNGDASTDQFVEIRIEGLLRINSSFDITVEGFDAFKLTPAMIGDSGVVIAADDVKLDLSRTTALSEVMAAGFDESFLGAYVGQAQVRLPDGLPELAPEDLVLRDCVIGSGGVSGRLEAHYSPTYNNATKTFTGQGAGQLFGVPFGLHDLKLGLKQNAFQESDITGQLLLPFFDEPVDVGVGINLDGGFTVRSTSSTGLYTLTKPDLLSVELESLDFRTEGEVLTARLSGQVTPTFGKEQGLEWPSFQVKELAIDSEGNVHLEGGWLDLREQYSLDFHGFQMEITKLGFGKTEDGGKWIGFSGNLKLADGLPAGASVEGLRLTWYEDGSGREPNLSFNGVGVEFEVPEVLRFKGAVSYTDPVEVALPDGTKEIVERFDGAIKLDLTSLNMQIDGKLVVGSASGARGSYNFFAIYLAAELPAGIPIFSTGLALYGMAGLFALQMEPNKRPEEGWYENPNGAPGWYKRPEPGVTDLARKWGPSPGSVAFGAGATIGTLADNGRSFHGKFLLAVVFPGPIVLLEGRGDLLRERAELDKKGETVREPLFRALAVLDNRADTFLIGLDAQYKYGGRGELIDIRGGAEAFFSLSDASLWHIYLGEKEPREKRISAEVFRLFEANCYFMLDANLLALGAWVGYDDSWKFGPLRVALEAWIEGNAAISWKPEHYHGDLWIHGKAELSIYGFGTSLTVDARIFADVFEPFDVHGELSVGIDPPWPLGSYHKTIPFEWPPKLLPPPLSLLLKELAVEHHKVTTSWPLPRSEDQPLLVPDYDRGDGFLESPLPPDPNEKAPPPANAPVVPLDCRPHLTFARPVHDDAGVGLNPQPPSPAYEPIGDPQKNEGPVRVRYGLKEVALHRWDPQTASWAKPPVAWAPNTDESADEKTKLFGSWAPVPATADGGGEATAQTKLWLWSKTPFDYTRHGGSAWDEWFTDRFDDYPCVPAAPDREICCDFEGIRPDQELRSPWHCPDHPELGISWLGPEAQTVTVLDRPIMGLTRALCFPGTVRVPSAEKPVTNKVTISLREPAKNVRITVAGEQCITLYGPHEDGPNPRVEQGVTILVWDNPDQQSTRTTLYPSGLYCSYKTEIFLPRPSSFVQLTLEPRTGGEATIDAFDTHGNRVDTKRIEGGRATLTGAAITHVVVRDFEDEKFLFEICFGDVAGLVSATGFDASGNSYGPFSPQDQVIEVAGQDLVGVRVWARNQVCILQVCAILGPDPAEVSLREEMAEHLAGETARWSQTGDVLEPHTNYRLKVVTGLRAESDRNLPGYPRPEQTLTEFAYFRTEGPPGLTRLSLPVGTPNEEEVSLRDEVGNVITIGDPPRRVLDSNLNALAAYVRQTVPATVPAPGEKPPLPRPVYRAYDVGVELNEDYVDLMYRLERRDLGLYLYDNNNRPVRDAQDRLIVLSNRWGVTEELTLTEVSETRWIIVVNGSDCAAIDVSKIPHDKTLTSVAEGQVLAPDMLYEARLVPLLLHEDFGDVAVGTVVHGPADKLDRWTISDEVTTEIPSRWEVREEGDPPSRYIVQRSNIWGGSVDGTDPVKPGTLLLRADSPALPGDHPEQPGNWTDYRLSAYLRSADNDAIGLVFRHQDANHYYRFSMDRERSYRRLVRVFDGIPTVLAEDGFVYLQDRDYLITVEAIGGSLRVYQDGALVFDVNDNSISYGRIGLYCWGNTGARFDDVRVDDFRQGAPVVHRFNFITSRFANFFHHLHSFQDEVRPAKLTDLAGAIAALNQAAAPTGPPSEEEARAYEDLLEQVLVPISRQPEEFVSAALQQDPPEVQVSRVEHEGYPLAFLLRSPEPIDWKRAELEVLFAQNHVPRPELAGAIKLTDVTFGTTQPNEESVTLLVRETKDLTGHRIEHRRLPGPVAEPTDDPVLFTDEFEGETGGLLFREEFGPNALDHYVVQDEGTELGPSAWAVSDGHIAQTSNIFGESSSGTELDKPGTMALTGSPSWANARISATLSSEDDDAIGLVFRHQDANHYYRFSMDCERSYRRLIKKVNGTVSVLWQDSVAYDPGRSYELVIDTVNDRLLGYLDDTLLFNVRDPDLVAGRVGLYCWENAGARFEGLSVEALESDPALWEPAFVDSSEIYIIIDEAGTDEGPSQWAAADGVLTQTSNIQVVDDTPHRPGTYALGGSSEWRDVQISVRLRSNDGAIGVMFRVTPQVGIEEGGELGQDYYLFSMDRQHGDRRLVKKVGDAVSVLWQEAASYTAGEGYELTLCAVGDELRGYLDGALQFAVVDGDLKHGQVGFYCSANPGARFERVLVADRGRRIGTWTIHDEAMASTPSVWRLSGGALLQTSDIRGGDDPAYPGTHAVAGDPTWMDYRMAAHLRSDQDGAIGVLFRYVDEDNYYRLSLDAQRPYRRLVKKENGAVAALWEDGGSYAVGEPFTLTVEVVGPRIVGYQGDERLFDLTDGAHPSGQVGLYCWGNTGARFERLEVRRPPLDSYAPLRDRFSAEDVADWSFVNEGTEGGPPSWTVFEGALRQTSDAHTPSTDLNDVSMWGPQAVAGDSGWTDVVFSARLRSLDDDAIGVLFRYGDENNYYRFSMDAQQSYRRLVKNVGGAFTPLWEDAFAYEVGRTYEVTVVALGNTLRVYLDGVPTIVVEDGDLPAGRIGLYCWENSDARFSQVRVYTTDFAFGNFLLDEQFDVEVPGRWNIVDEGDLEGPSTWEVSGGELRQTSNVHGANGASNPLDRPGTYALAGDAAWTDYRAAVRWRSEGGHAIGVMLRYQDRDNYYLLSMDAQQSYRRLTKKVAGNVTVLWEDAMPFAVGREYVLTLDCVGERLTGYLDGVRLFAVEDHELGSGRVGLYCSANPGARFAEVRVAAPAWTPYYAFGSEEPLPAGTRVKVYAGNEAEQPPEEPGVLRRFVASFDEPGRLRLPEEGANLRLRTVSGEGRHVRAFLPETSYDAVAMRVLRKADGTGFFVAEPASTPVGWTYLAAGQYRLKLTYRRDNRAADPASQVLREADRSDPECVTIDIPWRQIIVE